MDAQRAVVSMQLVWRQHGIRIHVEERTERIQYINTHAKTFSLFFPSSALGPVLLPAD